MKKALFIAFTALLSVVTITAHACPKGTHPVGGTGSHHKGGTCV